MNAVVCMLLWMGCWAAALGLALGCVVIGCDWLGFPVFLVSFVLVTLKLSNKSK